MKHLRYLLPLLFITLLPISSFAEVAHFQFSNDVALNMVRGEIPAPIETTRFQSDAVSGSLKVNLADISKTTGSIKVDLKTIKSHTFNDSGKNNKQTEHMLNWFEIGPEVDAAIREKNRWATFTINKVTPRGASTKGERDEIGTPHIHFVNAEGTLKIHGVSVNKTLPLTVVIYEVTGTRYEGAKRVAMITNKKPLRVSLKEHDVKPRDTGGKFLAKALSVVGLKIADTAEITLDLRAFEAK